MRQGGSAAQRQLLRRPGIDPVPVRRQPPLRRQHLVRRARVAGPRADRPRPRHRAALLGRDARSAPSPFAGSAARHPHPLGPRAGPPVLHAGAQARRRASTSTARRRRTHGSLGEAFGEFMRPPFFPVTTKDLLGDIRFHDVWDADLELDGAKVKVRPVPHVGLTNGYRVEMGGATVAYLSDHQMPRRRQPRDLRRGARALRRRRPADPRRAVHRRRVPGEGHLGSLHRRLRGARGGRGRARAGWRCSTTTPPTTTTRSTRCSPTPASSPKGTGVDEVVAAHEGLVVSFG